VPRPCPDSVAPLFLSRNSGAMQGLLDIHGHLQPDMLKHIPYGVHALPTFKTSTLCLGPGDLSKVDRKHRVPAFEPWPCDKPNQSGSTAMGYVCWPSWTCRTCTCNFHNALCNRHAAAQPASEYNLSLAEKRSREAAGNPPPPMLPLATAWFRQISQELAVAYDEKLAYEMNWMEKWSRRKQDAIRKSVLEDLVCHDKVTGMVKREGGHNCPTKSRAIQFNTNFATQADLGPTITRCQKAFSSVVDGERVISGVSVTFASGMNTRTLGAWMQRARRRGATHFYERDGKNWDATMNLFHMEFKRLILEMLCPEGWALNALEKAEITKGTYRGAFARLKYSVQGTTKSGHNDTSLGNSIINAGIAIQAMLALGLKGDIIVMGDDLLVAVQGDFDAAAFAAQEARTGIIPEYRKFCSWRDVSFISGCWLEAADGMAFVPLLGRILARLMWTTKHWPEKMVPGWRHGVVCGMKPAVGGLPVYGAWLDANAGKADKTGKVVKLMEGDLLHKFECFSTVVEWDFESALKQMALRYHTSVDALRGVDVLLRHLQPGKREFLRHPLLDAIIMHDTADIQERSVTCDLL